MKPIRTPEQALVVFREELLRLRDKSIVQSDVGASLMLSTVLAGLEVVLGNVRVQLVEQEANALRRYVGTLEDQLESQRPSESADAGIVTIHLLVAGKAVCGFQRGIVPGDWPNDHKWVSVAEDYDLADGHRACAACEANLPEERLR